MAYIEYPKAVYLDGDVAKESKIVHSAADEAVAAEQGYRALPANPPVEPLQPGGAEHLPYPKMLYKGGQIDGETVVVKNADEQSRKFADGFLELGSVPPQVDARDDASDDAPTEKKGKRGAKA